MHASSRICFFGQAPSAPFSKNRPAKGQAASNGIFGGENSMEFRNERLVRSPLQGHGLRRPAGPCSGLAGYFYLLSVYRTNHATPKGISGVFPVTVGSTSESFRAKRPAKGTAAAKEHDESETTNHTLPFGGQTEHSVSGAPPRVGARGGFCFRPQRRTRPEKPPSIQPERKRP